MTSAHIYCSIRSQWNTARLYKETGMENKELYKTVELDVITFDCGDVIVTSVGNATAIEDEEEA